MLLQIQDGTLSAGGQTLLSHFQFEIKGDEKAALVGPNGCGKTTFLRLLAGEIFLDRNDSDFVNGLRVSQKITVGLLAQQAVPDTSLTVEEEILKSSPNPGLWERERFQWEQEYDRMFTGFGFRKEDKKKRLSQFSGGEQTKIALIRLLLQKPDLLLLDEPTNHLDVRTVEWLEQYLHHYKKAALIVSHDRFFLDRTAQTVWEIQNQKMIRYSGNYTAYRAQKQKNQRLLQKAWRQQQEEQKRLEALVERFKHKPRKASFARSRKKLLERMPKLEKPLKNTSHIFIEDVLPAASSSKWVLTAEHLQIGYDKMIYEMSLRIRRGQKIGVIGPNGAGKSAFLKTAAGFLPPVKGRCELGQNVTIGYFDQQASSLVSEQSVIEHFQSQFPALTEKEARSVLGSFLFSGKDASKKVSQLSGGEKSRLALCELFQSRPNFLILDEPTNHMDIPAKETLESAFRAYKGTLLFVSHDRYFIRQLAEALLIFGEQSVQYYPFGYEHYLEHSLRNPGGGPPLAQRTSEQQALLSGLQNVPKPERHRFLEISSETAYEEWQLALVLEPVEAIQNKISSFMENYDVLKAWTDCSYQEEMAVREEELFARYTDCCLNWYDKWLEFH